ncbi:ogr/Delta-like zinc finger family protein [Desulfosediminicola sp.]|uniref:ogr/Delta-like zinc finger family protein n=1 Tax=Desulfosediminicola sp. TaxID=2886825 RepID=UPI003AF2D02B
MRVYCDRCKNVAVIQSSSQESDLVKKLYCTCTNPVCGHSFVMDLSFSHTISPSALDMPAELLEKIKKTTRPQQQALFASVGLT